jgi:signal transduction histidine kinase
MDEPSNRRRRTRAIGSVRVRTTAAAVLVVGLTLIVAGFALVALLGRSLTSGVRATAEARADEVAATLSSGGSTALPGAESDEEFVQVIDGGGAVVASSLNVESEPALAVPSPGSSRRIAVPFDEGPFLVVAIGAATPDGVRTIVVGRSIDDVDEATAATARLLAVGIPVLVLVVGAVTWWIVGRALRPVDAITSEVDAISASALDRRVPEPETGDEIARLAGTMNRMLERLQRAQERQRRFVSDASHELRSPVASIRQHAEVAITHPDSTAVHELAAAVLEEDVRLQRLVDDLLLLARLDESDRERHRSDPIDLDDVVLREASRFDRTIHVDRSAVSAGRVDGDPAQVQRLVRNLLENAAKHARERLSVGVREANGWVVLTVEDDGAGVPVEDRERIFERFVRLDGARDRASGGSGLGLAIVRRVAVAHGGSVSVADGPLGGARFEVRLPRGTS